MAKLNSYNAERALTKLGRDVAIARRRRGFSQQRLADGASVGVATVRRLEAGDSGVSLGNLMMVLIALGETERLANMLDLAKDDVGLLMEAERLPKRIHSPRPRLAPGNVEAQHRDDGKFDGSDF